MKKRGYLAGLVIGIILLVGCNNLKEPAKDLESKSGQAIQIGITFDSYMIERWERDRDIFVSRANELGANVNVQNANGDVKKQKEQISYFIKKKVDVIVVIATDSNRIRDKVKEAKEQGIPVIAYDRLIKEANVDLYISFDNVMVGRMMGEAVCNSLPQGGNVVLLQGPTTDHNVEMMNEGIQDAFHGSRITVVDSM
ncbi:MAG: substrate-binding domain-containing protein, partial [Clostridium sp.]|nr:substrate-binding domain-containing protein [Clostridium sp.]